MIKLNPIMLTLSRELIKMVDHIRVRSNIIDLGSVNQEATLTMTTGRQVRV